MVVAGRKLIDGTWQDFYYGDWVEVGRFYDPISKAWKVFGFIARESEELTNE